MLLHFLEFQYITVQSTPSTWQAFIQEFLLGGGGEDLHAENLLPTFFHTTHLALYIGLLTGAYTGIFPETFKLLIIILVIQVGTASLLVP